MSRLLFSRGARGAIIHDLQRHLTDAGFDTHGFDGVYGGDTTAAVTAFQKKRGLDPTGSVDEDTWVAITGEPVPPVRDRCLGLTAWLEGHGYTLAQGNFDGAGITWGVIGFTLQHGELQNIVRSAFKEDENLVRGCFGDVTNELLDMCEQPWPTQLAWADKLSLGKQKAELAEPWKSGFAKFGETPIAQRMQNERAQDAYYTPALATAKKFGLTTETGAALCFDIHVQNGGIKSSAAQAVHEKMTPGMQEHDVRVLIANAVADAAKPQWREDVRSRKVAIANGGGVVRGVETSLRNWGIDEFEL